MFFVLGSVLEYIRNTKFLLIGGIAIMGVIKLVEGILLIYNRDFLLRG